MGEIITREDQRVTRYLSDVKQMKEKIKILDENFSPRFGGEYFINDAELCERLKVSDRTTQNWRSYGKIDYLQIEEGGKVLYRESDIQKFLEKHYQKAWAK